MSCPDDRGIWRYAQPHLRRLSWIALLSVASTALSLYLPYLTRDLIDESILKRDWPRLFQTVLIFVGVTLAGWILNIACGLKYTRVSAEILFEMRLELYRHLQRLGPRFWARARLGDVLSRLNNDISEIQRVAAETALAWIGNALFLMGAIAMMASLDLRLLAASLALIPPGLWSLRFYRRRLESRSAAVRQASASIGTFLIETLTGVRLIAASNALDREASRFRAVNDRFLDALMSLQRASYGTGGLPALILSVGTTLIFLYGGWLVIGGSMTVGTLAAFLAYHTRLLSPVQALMGMYANLGTARASLDRVRELFAEPVEVEERADAVRLAHVRGEIEFDGVSFAFDRGAVLDHLSFRVEPGETIAIIGPSGSGKSTIADLLLRFHDPDSGVIRLDGHDLRDIRLTDLRRHVALVEQEPFLFHDSIAANIRYGRSEATDGEVREAARAAQIGEFVNGLPEGYATIVGDRGLALSAGEKQRIALARAILSHPRVLILDEPSAALDPETERRLIASLDEIREDRTVIVITHRFELARWADRMLHHETASRPDR